MAYISFQPSDHFNTKIFTGNGSTQSITGVGFEPSLTWIKNRDHANHNVLFDAVRGGSKVIYANLANAEATASGVTAFDSDGFTLGNDSDTNRNTNSHASWNWLANGQGSSNTDGSINTTYTSANTTSGFSIVKYTGTGSNATVGHGLGVAPKMIMVKQTNTSRDWAVYHKFSNPDGTGAQYYMHLNNADARASNSAFWNNTDPTSSVIHLGSNHNTNGSGGTYIAYCFAEKQGYSKFGSYTGNGNADGVYQHLGFSASWLMIKRTDSSASWVIFDNKRLGYNVANYQLYANSNTSYGNNVLLDITSQGFKCRANHLDVNGSGATYIYMAFAEAPLVSSNGVPAVAR